MKSDIAGNNISANLPIEKLAGVGEKIKLAFNNLKIFTLEDLVHFLPMRVLDLSKPINIAKAKTCEGQKVTIKATVKSVSVLRTRVRHMWIVRALLEDKSGAIEAIWFNQPFMQKNLHRSKKLVFSGEVMTSKNELVLNSPQVFEESGLYPIYRQTKNLSSRQIARIIKKILKPSILPDDILPNKIIEKMNLMKFYQAAVAVHNPKSLGQFYAGRKRFLFEDLFIFAVANRSLKKVFEQEKSYPIKKNQKILKKWIDKLPFKLTKDQEIVLREIVADLKKSKPMNRIMQGDVGSGKTIIAFLAALLMIESGYNVALMAPTQILATQHFKTFNQLVKKINLKIKIALVKAKSKKIDLGAQMFIGTHALINQQLKNLALVIIDEQQRFGVKQRNIILEKAGRVPHYLSLSATPIPRSLAHVIFSSCDISIIKEKPASRKKIKTYLIPEEKRNDTYQFLKSLILQGKQAFVICPLIDPFDLSSDKKSVEAEFKNLQKTALAGCRLKVLHGALPALTKEKIMSDFAQKKIDVLISTSVVEVGVDIEDAAAIVIENAESFGLAQLHQFRGRVGRSDFESYCFVFCDKFSNTITKERLKAFVQNNDGFRLAELDLRLRGPGSFFDSNQSGFGKINPLWFENSQSLKDAVSAADQIVDELDSFPLLQEQISKTIKIKHLE